MAGWAKIDSPDDPERCQTNMSIYGQCDFKVIPGSSHCPRHKGSLISITDKRETLRNYNLLRYRDRINQFADNPQIKSLREEIGIVRIMIETIVNKCETDNDLLIYSNKLQNLILQAQKLVETCHKLEERTGMLLDKQSIIVVCDSLVKIIGEHVEDPDQLNNIAVQMLDVVAKIGGIEDTLKV